jgi:hypothetical protein
LAHPFTSSRTPTQLRCMRLSFGTGVTIAAPERAAAPWSCGLGLTQPQGHDGDGSGRGRITGSGGGGDLEGGGRSRRRPHPNRRVVCSCLRRHALLARAQPQRAAVRARSTADITTTNSRISLYAPVYGPDTAHVGTITRRGGRRTAHVHARVGRRASDAGRRHGWMPRAAKPWPRRRSIRST